MIIPLAVLTGVMLTVMVAAWVVQRAVGNAGWIDVFWSIGTGVCSAVAVLVWTPQGAGWRRLLLGGLVAVWGLRLGGYIAGRVSRGSEDVRYRTLRLQWGHRFQRRLLRFVAQQAPVSALLGFAVLCAARRPDPTVGAADAIGLTTLVVAIAGETMADHQMRRFKADPTRAGQVCDQGLWAWSRHPNYFFEALLWLAFPVIGTDINAPWTLLSWLAPAAMALTLRYGTGVPPLELALLQTKGNAYRQYQQRVPALLPRRPQRTARTGADGFP